MGVEDLTLEQLLHVVGGMAVELDSVSLGRLVVASLEDRGLPVDETRIKWLIDQDREGFMRGWISAVLEHGHVVPDLKERIIDQFKRAGIE